MMRSFLATAGIILLIVVAVTGALLAWSLGLGWVLTKLLSFSLFEGTLLAMLASLATFYTLFNFVRSLFNPITAPDFTDPLIYEIPPARFYAANATKTWESWFRYHTANIIYADLQDSPTVGRSMDKPQLQELAIRLAEICLGAVRAKSINIKRLRLTLDDLKKQMAKMQQKPYDDDILALAAQAVQPELEGFEHIFRSKLWDAPTTEFDNIE